MSSLPDSDVDAITEYIERLAPRPEVVARRFYPSGDDPNSLMGVIELGQYPRPAFTTYVTVGLAHVDWSESRFPNRLELACAMPSTAGDAGRLVATLAHYAATEGVLPRPGDVMANAVRDANFGDAGQSLPHALFMNPWAWGTALRGLRLSTGELWFLQVVAINDAEASYIVRNGYRTFLELVEAKRGNLADTRRASMVTAPVART